MISPHNPCSPFQVFQPRFHIDDQSSSSGPEMTKPDFQRTFSGQKHPPLLENAASRRTSHFVNESHPKVIHFGVSLNMGPKLLFSPLSSPRLSDVMDAIGVSLAKVSLSRPMAEAKLSRICIDGKYFSTIAETCGPSPPQASSFQLPFSGKWQPSYSLLHHLYYPKMKKKCLTNYGPP